MNPRKVGTTVCKTGLELNSGLADGLPEEVLVPASPPLQGWGCPSIRVVENCDRRTEENRLRSRNLSRKLGIRSELCHRHRQAVWLRVSHLLLAKSPWFHLV